MREWARKLDAKPKYVVSTSRRDFPWNNTFRLEGDLYAGRATAQGEDPARRAGGQPHALRRARAAGADRRVPSRRPPRSSPAMGRPCFRAWSPRGTSSSSRRRRLKSGAMALHWGRRKAGMTLFTGSKAETDTIEGHGPVAAHPACSTSSRRKSTEMPVLWPGRVPSVAS